MRPGIGIDPRQLLSAADEVEVMRRAAELGYGSAWTPAGPDSLAFDRCIRWYEASRLPTGIAVVPASGQPAHFYAEHATRAWEATSGNFALGVGSGGMERAALSMPLYLRELRGLLPPALPLYLAALGPRMLALAGQVADGVSLNWCSADWVTWSRARIEAAAAASGRPPPRVAGYIRTAVDPDPAAAANALTDALLPYALGPIAYRAHFQRMGFSADLRALEANPAVAPPGLLAAAGAHGAPGRVRPRFGRLAAGLDLPIVRILATRPGDVASALRVLEECRPG